MSLSHRWSKRLVFGALSLWGLVFISCVVVGRTNYHAPMAYVSLTYGL